MCTKILLLFLSLVSIIGLRAQNIQFEAADPQPGFLGALMGDVAVADVDADGDLDVFICGREDGWVSAPRTRLHLNDGTGAFTEMPNTPFPDVQFATARFNDVDGDGDQDLLLIGFMQSMQMAALYLNDGDGNFSLQPNTPFPPCQEAGLDFGDVDGDGDEDLFICGIQLGVPFCKLYINEGGGVFNELEGTSFTPMSSATVRLTDLDGDDDLDLMAAGIGGDGEPASAAYLNDGNAEFTPIESGIEPLTSMAFDLGDLDQDGDPDVILSGANPDFEAMTVLYLNDGTGAFIAADAEGVFTNVFAGLTFFVDFDGDTDLDILLSGSSDGGLGSIEGIVSNVYENLGENNFALADSLTGSYFSSNAIGDLNGDGLVDIILSGTTVGTPNFKTWIYFNSTDAVLGLQERSSALFDVFPNPSNGLVNIRLKNFEKVTIEIYSMSGSLVFSMQNVAENLTHFHTDLPSGIYSVVVKNAHKIEARKIVIVD